MPTITLHGSGRRFQAEDQETVLEAARRAGLALPYSCLGGVCGSCRATVLEGEVHYPHQPPRALSPAEAAHHDALLCQAVALGDLRIAAREVPSVADYPRRQLAVKVVERAPLAEDVMKLTLRPPRGEALRYLPGQYLDVLLPGGKRRAFSIANAPRADGTLELHVRRVAGGGFTGHVFDGLREGEVLRIEGPLGTFVAREDSQRPMLFVAGGTGFAPIQALLEHFAELRSARPMRLYRGVRHAAELYAASLPSAWRERLPQLAATIVVSEPGADWAGRTGTVTQAVLDDHPALVEFDVYLSGPPAMVEHGRHAFVQAGLPEERLYYDSFEYAPDVLAAVLNARAGIDHR